MVDGSACEVIDTGTVKVTRRDGIVRALEVVQYVLEARYNLISIRGEPCTKSVCFEITSQSACFGLLDTFVIA